MRVYFDVVCFARSYGLSVELGMRITWAASALTSPDVGLRHEKSASPHQLIVAAMLFRLGGSGSGWSDRSRSGFREQPSYYVSLVVPLVAHREGGSFRVFIVSLEAVSPAPLTVRLRMAGTTCLWPIAALKLAPSSLSGGLERR